MVRSASSRVSNHAGPDRLWRELALARRFQAPEQQRQQRVDPRGLGRIVPLVGMGGMVIARGGVEYRTRGHLGVDDLEGALLDAIGQDMRDLLDQALLVRLDDL